MAHKLSDPCRCGHAHIEYASIDFSEVDVAGARVSKWCIDPGCPCDEYVKGEKQMKIVEPYARMRSNGTEYLSVGPENTLWPEFTLGEGVEMLRRVEYAARVSHGSEEKQTMDSYDRFLRSVILQHGDWSVAEHEKVTCEFLMDRGITHETVRHRIASYTQESTRFINYKKKKGGEAKFVQPKFNFPESVDDFLEMCRLSEACYFRLLERGETPQMARSVFLTALASKIEVTMNLRSWRHFFIMRTSAQAHPQMLQVTLPLLREFQEKIPILYEDLVPGRQQSEAMAVLK